jgi:hypothetical protein
MRFTELLPRQAALADKFTVLRSMHQGAGGHPAGSMQMFSGDSTITVTVVVSIRVHTDTPRL